MDWTLIAMGNSGARLAEAVLFSGMAGQMPSGSVRILTVGGNQDDTRLEKLIADSNRVRNLFGAAEHAGFCAGFGLANWQLPEKHATLADLVEGENDRLLCRVLFTAPQAGADFASGMGGEGPVSAVLWEELLQKTSDESIREMTGSTDRLILCGSVCESACAAGINPLVRRLRRVFPERKLSAVLLGPVRQHDHAGMAEETLANLTAEKELTALSVISMPEDCLDSRKEGTHLCDWFAAVAMDRILRGQTGGIGFRVKAGPLCWDDFGSSSPEAAWTGLLRAGWLLESGYAESLSSSLSAPNWLRDRLSSWYMLYFSSVKYLPAEERAEMLEALESFRRLTQSLCRWLDSIQQALPAAMRWSRELQEAKGKSSEHYARLLDVAAQLALLRHEAEKSGMAEEHFVHRHNMEETEAEAVLRQIGELEEKLQQLNTEQDILDRAIGGRQKRNMLSGFVSFCQQEADHIAGQAEEAHRVIDRAAEIASPEEMPKIDSARSRLERMERHLAVLQGRADRAKADLAGAEAPDKRLLAPEITGETNSGLFSSFALQLFSQADTHDRKDRKKLLEQNWPWPEMPVRTLSQQLLSAAPSDTIQSPMGRFLNALMSLGKEAQA